MKPQTTMKKRINMPTRTLLTLLLVITSSGMYAQEGLEIASVFRKYGKHKGVTMVELSNELVDMYEMELYKSISFKDISETLPYIQQCLEADKQQARKVKEVVAGGEVQSGYYQLSQQKKEINRFILYRTGKKNSATLIYIEGKLEADDLVTLLFLRKD